MPICVMVLCMGQLTLVSADMNARTVHAEEEEYIGSLTRVIYIEAASHIDQQQRLECGL